MQGSVYPQFWISFDIVLMCIKSMHSLAADKEEKIFNKCSISNNQITDLYEFREKGRHTRDTLVSFGGFTLNANHMYKVLNAKHITGLHM